MRLLIRHRIGAAASFKQRAVRGLDAVAETRPVEGQSALQRVTVLRCLAHFDHPRFKQGSRIAPRLTDVVNRIPAGSHPHDQAGGGI